MTPDHLSAMPSMIFMAIVAAALAAHVTRLAGPDRLVHGLYALIAAGLFYLFGTAALGWNFIPREALLGCYALAFLAVAGLAASGRAQGLPVNSLLIQLAAMAYMWGPINYWKPPFAALFLLYFVVELAGWIRGRQPAAAENEDSHRPPLIPPKPVRGLREFALIGAGAALVYSFAAGTGAAPVAETPPAEEAAAEPSAPEQAASEQAAAEPSGGETAAASAESEAAPSAAATETAAREPDAAPAAPAEPVAPPPPVVYKTVTGDTLKSIARKLYGKPEKWRAIASVNPTLKPGVKLKAGQTVKLPEPPTR